MPDNAVQRLKQLEQERSQLLSAAKKEALERAQSAINDLNALGFNYRLTENGAPGRRAARKGRRGQLRDAPCPVCNFKTSPPHDARRHRSQGKRKRPFSANELAELGLKKA